VKRRSTLSVAILSAAFLVFSAAFGPTLESGLSPRTAEAAGVTVTVKCSAAPETTRVANNTGHRITIKKVGSIYQPGSNEPFSVSRTLRSGQAVVFESGYGANHNTLTRQYIYNNEVGSKEGARVTTGSGNRLVDRCG